MSMKRWVFQLEVRGRVVEPREALGHLAAALSQIVTSQGDHPVWQVTQGIAPIPGVPHQLQLRAMTSYPPGGTIQIGTVASNAAVAYHNFRGTVTLLTINFADNLGWRVGYTQVPPHQAVQQKYPDGGLGYAETVFDTTIGTIQDVLVAHYGQAAVVGMEQDV